MSDGARTNIGDVARAMFKEAFPPLEDFTLLLRDRWLAGEGSRLAAKIDQSRNADVKAQESVSNLGEDWWYRYCCEKTKRRSYLKDRTSFEFDETVIYPNPPKHDIRVTARLQVSRCFNDGAWSVTVRCSRRPPTSAVPSPPIEESDWAPSHLVGIDPTGPTHSMILVSISEIVSYLQSCLPVKHPDPIAGLVLVTGGTNSGKSLVARGLAWQCLQGDTGRKAHLVTYEDPVERYLWKFDSFKLEEPLGPHDVPLSLDYTPRQYRFDCGSLREALDSALRQTPRVFYVGEIRSPNELKLAVEFGGTGHLIVATAHAGSLVEAVAKIMDAMDARRAGSRAICAPKVLAVVHLRRLTATVDILRDGAEEPWTATAFVPAIYRRTTEGLQSLIADGLAALLPHCPEIKPRDSIEKMSNAYGTLGRRFFLNWLGPDPGDDTPDESADIDIWEEVRRASFTQKVPPSQAAVSPLSQTLINRAMEDDLYGR